MTALERAAKMARARAHVRGLEATDEDMRSILRSALRVLREPDEAMLDGMISQRMLDGPVAVELCREWQKSDWRAAIDAILAILAEQPAPPG